MTRSGNDTTGDQSGAVLSGGREGAAECEDRDERDEGPRSAEDVRQVAGERCEGHLRERVCTLSSAHWTIQLEARRCGMLDPARSRRQEAGDAHAGPIQLEIWPELKAAAIVGVIVPVQVSVVKSNQAYRCP